MTTAAHDNLETTEYDALFRTLINTAVDGIMVIDERATVRIYNPACTRLFGYTPEEIVGRNVNILMPEPDRSKHDRYVGDYLRTGTKKIIGIGREVLGRRKDGSTFPMYLSVGEGVAAGQRIFVGIVHDISQRQAHDRHIRELQQELLHVTRLTAMGQMTSALAHELNQPLTAVSNYANAARRMLEGVQAPQIQMVRDMLAKAVGQIIRAGEIIRRLREFIEKREANQTPEDINCVVSDAMALALVGAADANVKVETRFFPDIPGVFMDKIQIEQVMVNLLRNAVEAMENSDRRILHVSTEVLDEDFVQVAVADTGPGLPDEVRGRVFQPFVTTKNAGLGMGLSICRSIIEAHGGRIAYASNAGGGTIFRFTLPYSPEPCDAG